MERLFEDLKYALRSLYKSPGFSATAILAMAIGIGANTAMFSLVNAILLRSLPFPDPDKIAVLMNTAPGGSTPPCRPRNST